MHAIVIIETPDFGRSPNFAESPTAMRNRWEQFIYGVVREMESSGAERLAESAFSLPMESGMLVLANVVIGAHRHEWLVRTLMVEEPPTFLLTAPRPKP